MKPKTRGVKAVVTHSNQFLLVRIGYAHKRWTLPGGQVERNEDFKTAAMRELREETGVVVNEMTYLDSCFSTLHHKRDTVQYFTAESADTELIIDDQEIVDAGWFARSLLPEERNPSVDRGIAMYDKHIHVHE